MARKTGHIIITFLLLFATTGMVVSKHYCGDFLIYTAFYSEAESCCSSSSCCHNETVFYQLDEDFTVPNISQLPEIIDVNLLFTFFEVEFAIFRRKSEKSFFTERKPPPPSKIQTTLSLEQSWLL